MTHTIGTNAPYQPQRRNAVSLGAACIAAAIALAGITTPALGQATMRPKNQPSSTTPSAPPQAQPMPRTRPAHHHHLNHPRFHHKSDYFRSSSIVYQSGGVTFVTGTHSRWPVWCDRGHGFGLIGIDGPHAVYYGSSGLRQIGPTFDELRTFVPATSRTGQLIIAEPPREPTPEERLVAVMRDRSYDDAQTLARQQGNARLEALALLGRGQVQEAVDKLASAYRQNPELFNDPLIADDLFANANETRRLLGIAVRNAHREPTAEAWFLVSAIMRAQGRHEHADRMMDRARDAERQQQGVVPREPATPTTTTPPHHPRHASRHTRPHHARHATSTGSGNRTRQSARQSARRARLRTHRRTTRPAVKAPAAHRSPVPRVVRGAHRHYPDLADHHNAPIAPITPQSTFNFF